MFRANHRHQALSFNNKVELSNIQARPTIRTPGNYGNWRLYFDQDRNQIIQKKLYREKKIIGIVFYERIEENPAFPFRSDIT